MYNILVNKHSGIRERYHKFHDSSYGVGKVLSWIYLLWLNFCYYFLCCHFLEDSIENIEKKKVSLPLKESESFLAMQEHKNIQESISELSQYDVISFDIFDTLIFRPFSAPTDLFYFIGEKIGILDFKRIRVEAEERARWKCYTQRGHSEIKLEDIWKLLEEEIGVSAQVGMELEMKLEEEFCYANPFMLEVFKTLQKEGKQIIILSDMYLPSDFLMNLLEKNGIFGFQKLYVSCEYEKSKSLGNLFEMAKSQFSKQVKTIHVGDNPVSDIKMAQRYGIDTYYYPNVNGEARKYRTYDMSPIIGSAYRGIINSYLYSGKYVCGMEYEYGFIYGGLFALGYCNFIHQYCKKNNIDKVLFLSRDGDILKKVYNIIFPEENTEYVYWSRAAATKLMAGYNRHDYYRRFLYHKVNQEKTLEQIFQSMELEELLQQLPRHLKQENFLTDKNVEEVKTFLDENWDKVLLEYTQQQKAAEKYYREILKGCKRVCAVDIGWAGSGAVSLNYLVQRVWKISCQVIGMIAGTNTIHNAEPDASEIFLQSGELVSYLYSQSFNRDLMKKHDPNCGYNIFWELLLVSPTRQFKGFYMRDNQEVEFHFGKQEKNQEGVRQIQQGILDFVAEYKKHFENISYMYWISGRDAYAPMLAAADYKEIYLKTIESKFAMDINVE